MSALPSQVFDLLHHHCTGYDDDKQRTFLEKVNSILEGSLLRRRSSEETWAITWDKPLYANQGAHLASVVRQRVAEQWFKSPGAQDLPEDPEVLRGLRDPRGKLQRIRGLAEIWEEFYAAHEAAAAASLELLDTRPEDAVRLIRELIGLPGYSSADPAKLFHILQRVPGIAEITALHILMDLGYPLCKPDRWLVRLAAATNDDRRTDIAQRMQALPVRVRAGHRLIVETILAVDIILEDYPVGQQPREVVGLDRAFLRGRFCDLILCKFGMQRESAFGIVRSGVDTVLGEPAVAARYPDLVPIAERMKDGDE